MTEILPADVFAVKNDRFQYYTRLYSAILLLSTYKPSIPTTATIIAISILLNQCVNVIVSQVFTRPLARQFEQNTEERLANLEESPRGFQEKFECQRDERGDILSYIRETSGEEIQKETKVNNKSLIFKAVISDRRPSRLRQ